LAAGFDVDNWEPVVHGPVWTLDKSGESYVLPEHTLGWECALFAAKWLHIDDGEGGFKPFQFTNEQLRFVLWFYAIDEAGRFVYRRTLLQRLKGWGKDPIAAVLALFEAVGRCRFSHFDEAGNVVGTELKSTYVQIAAVSQEQSRNTSDMFRALLTDEAIDHFSFSLGKEVQYARGGQAQIVCVTSNPYALEGKRPTFIVSNEVQYWFDNNRGTDMYRILNGNNLKASGARMCHMLLIANAPIPGTGSVAETLIESYTDTLEGRGEDRDLLYDSLEAPANAPIDRDTIERVVTVVRGDSVWLDPSSVSSDFFDKMVPISEARRKWFNQTVADSDSVYTVAELDGAQVDATLAPGDEITLGFDGGRTDDATALVAVRVSDSVAFQLGVWEKPRDAKDWVVPRDEVHSAVHEAFSTFDVKAFFADVNLWESDIMGWSVDYGDRLSVRSSNDSAIAWDMRGVRRATAAHERMVHAVKNGRLRIARGSAVLLRHTGNVRRRVNIHGLSFAKESRESPRKVDAYAAMMLAFEAMRVFTEGRARAPEKRKRTGRVGFY